MGGNDGFLLNVLTSGWNFLRFDGEIFDGFLGMERSSRIPEKHVKILTLKSLDIPNKPIKKIAENSITRSSTSQPNNKKNQKFVVSIRKKNLAFHSTSQLKREAKDQGRQI